MKSNSSFSFFTPTRIEYGPNKADTLLAEIHNLDATFPLIVTDRGVMDAGLLGKIETQLQQNKFPFDIFSDIASNPTDISVAAAADLAREKGHDLVIGVGGGSAMDAAKAIALLALNGGRVHDYFGYDKMEKRGLPLITIPTTAGTGSEVTIWAVITDTRGEIPIKASVGSGLICPNVALVDPCMTLSMPPLLTAYTGLDALSHAVEGYCARAANPISDVLALAAIDLIATYLAPAVFHGDNLEARDHMMLGSLMAGLAFSNADTAAVHSMGEAIGGMYDTHHGLIMGVLMPHVMRYNLMACPTRYAAIAKAMGENIADLSQMDAAEKAVAAVQRLNRILDLPALKDLGVEEGSFADLSKIAMENLGTVDNPRKMTAAGFEEILNSAYYLS
jgi:alcohol dehydrogenase